MSNNVMSTTIRKWSLTFAIGSFLLIHTGVIIWWASTQTSLTKKLAEEITHIQIVVEKKVSVIEFKYLTSSLDLAIKDLKLTIKEDGKGRIYKGEILQIIQNLNNKVEVNSNRIDNLKQDHKDNMSEIKTDLREIKIDIRELLTKKR